MHGRFDKIVTDIDVDLQPIGDNHHKRKVLDERERMAAMFRRRSFLEKSLEIYHKGANGVER